MTADSDKGRSGTAEVLKFYLLLYWYKVQILTLCTAQQLKFTVNRPCYVYVLRDIRGTAGIYI